MKQNRTCEAQEPNSLSDYQYRRTYRKISSDQRLKAIKLIKQQKMSYRKTSKQLRISVSTIKLIVTRFQKTGTVFKKKISPQPRTRRQEKAKPEVKIIAELQQQKHESQPRSPQSFPPCILPLYLIFYPCYMLFV